MSKRSQWSQIAAKVIYEAYLDHDVLPIEPPKPEESIREFTVRAEDARDTLFLFLCREADDDIDVHVYLARLDRAIGDIQSVRDALQKTGQPACSKEVLGNTNLKLAFDQCEIELTLSRPDAAGRRQGSVSSNLHSSIEGDDGYNGAMDAIESMILAHACAGIDVTDSRYIEGVRTCVYACGNHFPAE